MCPALLIHRRQHVRAQPVDPAGVDDPPIAQGHCAVGIRTRQPDIVRFALQWTCVRGVTFQPIQDAGRNDGFEAKAHRMVLSEVRRAIAEAGVFALEDLIPLPCNPDEICIGYGLRNGSEVIPITSLSGTESISRPRSATIRPNSPAFASS